MPYYHSYPSVFKDEEDRIIEFPDDIPEDEAIRITDEAYRKDFFNEGIHAAIAGVVSGRLASEDFWKGLVDKSDELMETLHLAVKGYNKFTDRTSEDFNPEYAKSQEDAVNEIVSLVGLGGMSGNAGGPGTAGTFGGIRGLYETLGQAGLDKVKRAEKLNKIAKTVQDREQIWRDLGMFKDVDGKWRFEIDDVQSRIITEELASAFSNKGDSDDVFLGKYRSLGRVFDHPELYKYYPELKDMKVTLDIGPHNKDNPSRGWQSGKEIFVRGNDPEDARSTLLHEIQHRIQDIEGFARGGNPERIKEYAIDVLSQEKDELLVGLLEMHDPNGSIYNDIIHKAIQDPNIKITDIESIYLDTIKNSKSPEVQKLYKMWKQHHKWLDQLKEINTDADKFKLYKRLLGEIEARNVQHRRNMTPEQRKFNHPIFDDMDRFESTGGKSPVVLQGPAE